MINKSKTGLAVACICVAGTVLGGCNKTGGEPSGKNNLSFPHASTEQLKHGADFSHTSPQMKRIQDKMAKGMANMPGAKKPK